MLRVLHVLGRMPGNGTERQLAGMRRAAHFEHWNATLCVLRSGDELPAQLAGEGIPVMEYPSEGKFDVRRAIWLRRLMSEHDVVHTSLPATNRFVQSVAMTMRHPALVVSERAAGRVRTRAQLAVHRMARPNTTYYLGNSVDVCDYIERVHRVDASRIGKIANGIDASTFHLGALLKRKTGKALRIGTTGRLTRVKAHDVLISALPAILKHHDVELHIAGDGPLHDALRELSKGFPVNFVGYLASPDQMADFLRSLDLFVMPSLREGLPNALLEAIACGVPVVATDAPGMADATGGQVPLVPAGDVTALAEAVIAALSNPVVPRVEIASFDDVAQAHAKVFRAAADTVATGNVVDVRRLLLG